jgi:hypothetical protein
MPDQRLRAILEFLVKGDQKVEKALKGVTSATSKATIQQGVMAQRSNLLSSAQQRLSKRVLEGNLSVEKASRIYQRYEKSLPTEALEGLNKTQKNTQTGMQQIQSVMGKVALAAGTVGAAMFAAKKAFDFAKEGAALNQLEDSFNGLNQRVLKTPTLLNDMRKAVNGTVDDVTLMSGVMTLVAGQSDEMARTFAQSSPQLLKIAKAAQKLNPSLGDTSFLFQSISTGIKRQSPLILDNLGLTIKIGEANDTYAKRLGKTAAELSASEKQQALLNEVMRAGDVLIQQAGGSADSMADSYAQASVAFKNFTDNAKKGFATFIGGQIVAGRAADVLNEAIQDEIIGVREQIELRERLKRSGLTNAEATIKMADAIMLVRDGYAATVDEGLKLLSNEYELNKVYEDRAKNTRQQDDLDRRRQRAASLRVDTVEEESEAWQEYRKIQDANRKSTEEFIKARAALNEQIRA